VPSVGFCESQVLVTFPTPVEISVEMRHPNKVMANNRPYQTGMSTTFRFPEVAWDPNLDPRRFQMQTSCVQGTRDEEKGIMRWDAISENTQGIVFCENQC
jgi:hypothetical protein